MRIVYLASQMDVGGIETNLVRLAAELIDRGHHVSVISRGGRLVEELTNTGATHHEVLWGRSPRAIVSAGAVVARVIRTEAPDILHVFSASMNLRLMIARLLRWRLVRRTPLISSIMGLKNTPDESRWKTYLRAYCTVVGVDRIVVISPAINAALRRLPIRRSRLVAGDVVGVPLPKISKDALREARAELGLSDSDYIVMTVGRLDPSKSPELFLMAVRSLAGTTDGFRAVLIGGGPLENVVTRTVASLGLQKIVVLAGERLDAPQLLSAADVYVRPGVVEGFVGITVLEAQIRGIPVIAFETEDVKLAIEHGRSGWLVPVGDAHQMGNAIRSLFIDKELAKTLGSNGRAQVLERFAMPVVADGLLSLYEDEIVGA